MSDDIEQVIAELERLEQSATPGPWLYRVKSQTLHRPGEPPYEYDVPFAKIGNEPDISDADLDLLLYARNHIGSVLRELREARAQRDRANDDRDGFLSNLRVTLEQKDGLLRTNRKIGEERDSLRAQLEEARAELASANKLIRDSDEGWQQAKRKLEAAERGLIDVAEDCQQCGCECCSITAKCAGAALSKVGVGK